LPVPLQTSLCDLFAEELRLCGVEPGAAVGVLTQGRKRLDYADAVAAACQKIGATVFHVDIPSEGAPDDGGELGVRAADTGLHSFTSGVVRAFEGCYLVVDLVFLLWSEQQTAIRRSGTRMISCVEPPATLKRLFPSPELKRQVLAALDALHSARELRVVSDAGTDVKYELGQFGYIHQYGIADEPGRWDHFASALVGTVGSEGGVEGTVVLAPGDILFPHSIYVSTPTRIEIRKGRITRIEGGLEAILLRDYLQRFDDENAYGISHIGWGMSPHARWDALAVARADGGVAGAIGIGMDSRSFLGSVMFSTGPNVEFGGSNNTACHTDIPMRNCSVLLDGRPVVDYERVLTADLVGARSGSDRPRGSGEG
jgi:2,5-dihydroxypyridine 5,6-dioxygenase